MSDPIERKEDIVEMETVPPTLNHEAKPGDEATVLDSRFAHLGFKETVLKFHKVCLICMGIFVGALFDGESHPESQWPCSHPFSSLTNAGYAVGIPGNMAANANFIERFGNVVVNGQLQLDAQWVAAWGGIQSGGQIVGMISGGFISVNQTVFPSDYLVDESQDRFGRKANMYTLVSLLLLVRHLVAPEC